MHKLFTDGGARGNPGPAGIGAVIYNDSGEAVLELAKYIGHATNNIAEYTGLIVGLTACLKKDVKSVICHLDSELVVKQLNGEYKVKNEGMKKLYDQVKEISSNFEEISFKHIPRSENAKADQLVNFALDNEQKN